MSVEITGDIPVPPEPSKRGRSTKDKGVGLDTQGQKPPPIKSHLKVIEEMQAEAAPAADPINRTAKPAPAADPYDPDRYTESVDFTKLAGTKPLISQLPVSRPAPDDYIRTHPDIVFSNVPLCAPSGEKGQLYLMDSSNEELLADMLKYTRNYFLFYTVTAENKLFLWPIVGPHPDSGKWHQSPQTAAIAAERARTEWVQVSHMEGLGYVAEGPRTHGKTITKVPAFADFARRRILELAFRSFTIKDYDHPYVRRCLFMSAGVVQDGE